VTTVKRSHVHAAFIAAAATGLLIFGFLSWRVTTVERASPDQALRRFEALRPAGLPILEVTADGAVARRELPPEAAPLGRLVVLHVLVYHVASQRLAESRIPFWFFRLKAPAAQYALEGTGLDLQRLGITASELERFGPRVVLEHRTAAGNRVLIWTE
jgi:hypothetical protein